MLQPPSLSRVCILPSSVAQLETNLTMSDIVLFLFQILIQILQLCQMAVGVTGVGVRYRGLLLARQACGKRNSKTAEK